MVPAEPITIAKKVRMDPIASVETPVIACPTVQPIASTPPTPINAPPAACRAKSPPEANHSRRKLRVASA